MSDIPEKGRKTMYGLFTGISDNDDFDYCPFCGEKLYTYHADGTGKCMECKRRFAVIEIDEEDMDELKAHDRSGLRS